MVRGDRAGWVLLEVLLALAVLGLAAASFAGMLYETTAAVDRGRSHERTIERAERIVRRYAVHGGEDLERFVGRWTEDGLGVRLSRLGPALFEVIVVAPDGVVALEAALYRPTHEGP